MKALILYRSHYGNTKEIAEEMAKELRARGVDSIVADLRRRLPNLDEFDAALVGAPTRMARVTGKALRALRRLHKMGLGRKPLALFDTYGPLPATPEELEKGKKWLYPGAVGLMKARAETLGLNVFPKTLRCEVKGMKGPLKDGEKEKVAAFIDEFARTISKKA